MCSQYWITNSQLVKLNEAPFVSRQKKRLIVVLVGTKTEKKQALVSELEDILNQQDITFCYLEIQG